MRLFFVNKVKEQKAKAFPAFVFVDHNIGLSTKIKDFGDFYKATSLVHRL